MFHVSGIHGVPCDVVALAAHEITSICNEIKHLKEIHFVDITDDFLLDIQRLFEADVTSGQAEKIPKNSVSSTILSIMQPSGSASGTGQKLTEDDTLHVQSSSNGRRYNREDQFSSRQSVSSSEPLADTPFTEKWLLVNRSVKVILHKQDISEMRVDAIINPTDVKLSQTTGISALLKKKAGPKYAADCQKINFILDVEVTRAGDLPCKLVIHAPTPRFFRDRVKQGQCVEKLKKTVCSVFERVKQLHLKSVAFPVIGGGK